MSQSHADQNDLSTESTEESTRVANGVEFRFGTDPIAAKAYRLLISAAMFRKIKHTEDQRFTASNNITIICSNREQAGYRHRTLFLSYATCAGIHKVYSSRKNKFKCAYNEFVNSLPDIRIACNEALVAHGIGSISTDDSEQPPNNEALGVMDLPSDGYLEIKIPPAIFDAHSETNMVFGNPKRCSIMFSDACIPGYGNGDGKQGKKRIHLDHSFRGYWGRLDVNRVGYNKIYRDRKLITKLLEDLMYMKIIDRKKLDSSENISSMLGKLLEASRDDSFDGRIAMLAMLSALNSSD